MTTHSRPVVAILAAALYALVAGPAAAQAGGSAAGGTTGEGGVPAVDAARYDRAAQRLPAALAPLILNHTVTPHWRSGVPERFTYRRELGDGRAEFVQVEAATGRRSPAFDATLVARGLAAATGTTIEADRLPFADYEETPQGLRIEVGARAWLCATTAASCRDAGAVADPMAVASPDGRWFAYTQDGNLWLRSADGSTRVALTSDGEPHWRYADDPDVFRATLSGGDFHTPPDNDGRVRAGPPTTPMPPAVAWSPDSRRLFVQRIDERAVRETSITQSTPTDGSSTPARYAWRSALPNDAALPMAEEWIYDVDTRAARKVDLAPIPVMYSAAARLGEVSWSADGREVRLLARSRYMKTLSLHVIDAATGAVRTPIVETGATFVESAAIGERPMHRYLRDGRVLWWSQRSGYGHLYLYDASGRLLRPLTHGDWNVREVVQLDEDAGYVYVAGTERDGDDPYCRGLYRIRLRDGALARLTPELADHAVVSAQTGSGFGSIAPDRLGFAPSGRWFVETYSRVDLPETTVLRRADGTRIALVETADTSRLKAVPLRLPERFSALAADGRTRLYGVIWRPSDYDPARRYPVLDSIYPGPQTNRAQPGYTANLLDRMGSLAYAELGMVVVALDGRGTPGRSKRFLDYSYGKLGDPGALDDHIAVLRELARRDASLDLERVGMFGTSGGGYATAHALFMHPEFYKVGVSDAGNHDQRGYIAIWGETYNGPVSGDNYTSAANRLLASGLTGKLLLLHGDMDANVMPYHTLQVADALIAARKDFELLIVPNQGHTTIMRAGYPLRRAWDFLVRNLIGATPPVGWNFPVLAPPAR